jgi:hypothetical protein
MGGLPIAKNITIGVTDIEWLESWHSYRKRISAHKLGQADHPQMKIFRGRISHFDVIFILYQKSCQTTTRYTKRLDRTPDRAKDD